MTRLFRIYKIDELGGWVNGLGRIERMKTDLLPVFKKKSWGRLIRGEKHPQ